MKKIKYLPINWQNGMLLTEKYFRHTHCEFIENLHQARQERLTRYNYGLGESPNGDTEAVQLEIVGSSIDSVQLSLKYCNAITHSGSAILYSEELYGSFRPTVSLAGLSQEALEQGVLVALTADPYEGVPVGYPSPNESPLRHPHVLPKIALSVLPIGAANASFLSEEFIVIGKGQASGGFFSLDVNYIPPVQRLKYSPKLLKSYQSILAQLQMLDTQITHIYKKNLGDRRRSDLTASLFSMCSEIQMFNAQHFFALEYTVVEQPPVEFFQKINIMARSVANALIRLQTKDFEALLQYFYEWTDVTPSEFDHALNNMVALKYDHIDIEHALIVSKDFTNKLSTILGKMSELEYVGLIRENIIISDDSYEKEEKPRRTFRFLD